MIYSETAIVYTTTFVPFLMVLSGPSILGFFFVVLFHFAFVVVFSKNKS